MFERSFATALGARVGDSIALNGRSFTVAGIAVTVAVPPYPRVCSAACSISPQVGTFADTGLLWLTRADTQRLATSLEPLAYSISLRLVSPAGASTLADSFHRDDNTFATSWQQIRASIAKPRANERAALLLGSGLLGVLAIASCAVLVGGRMAHQRRRAGLTKTVGGTPELIAAVLLTEYVVVSLIASAIGLGIGRLVAPALADPGTGLLGTAETPAVTPATVGVVLATALTLTSPGLRNPDTARIDQVLLVVAVMLSILAAVNAAFITWATVIDTRRSSAITRTLGATPYQTGAAISTAHVIPALLGAILGLPAGVLLVLAVGGHTTTAYPAPWILLGIIPATGTAIAATTALPAWFAAQRPVAEALRTDAG